MNFNSPDLLSDVRDAYENYLLANSLQERQKALSQLIEGSQEYKVLSILDKITKGDQELTTAEQKLVNERYSGGIPEQNRSIFKRMRDFKAYDQANQSTRGKALDQIMQELGIKDKINRFDNFSKPYKQEHAGEQDLGIEEEKKSGSSEQAKLPKDFFKRDLIANLKTNAKTYKDNANQQFNYLRDMPLYLAQKIDFNLFNYEAVYRYIEHLARNNTLAGIANESLFKSLKTTISKKKSDYSHWELDSEVCRAMTLEQIKHLKSFTSSGTDVCVIGSEFEKQFDEELSTEAQEVMTNEDKYANLNKLYEAAKSQGLPKSLQFSLLEQMLRLGPKLNIYDKNMYQMFVSWMEQRHGNKSITQAISSSLFDSHSNANWNQYISNVKFNADYTNQNQLNELYLERFAFEKNGNLSEFKKKDGVFLPMRFVEAIEKRVKVYQSQNGISGLKDIDADYYKQIADEVSLKFLPENKDKFKVNDLVTVRLEIKNVDAVHCKVFEFNTLTFYRKNLKPFDTTIDLDGLESTITKKFDTKQAPNQKVKQEFEFPELNNRVGLFIIEFLGNGCSARAVVKKGSLSLIHRSTVAGHMCYILDDERKVCKGNPNAAGEGSSDSVGMWLSGKFYEAKLDGSIFVPYAHSQQSSKAILQNGEFAQLIDEFKRCTETYTLNCNFFLLEESVLVGQKTQIIITPRLFINGRKASLSQLKNARAILRTSNYIDGTPVTKHFTGLKFEDDKETTISFRVSPNTEYISVEFLADVQNSTTKKLMNFNKHKQFTLNTQLTDPDRTCELYLRMLKNNNYEVLCLGRNGEARPYMRFTCRFEHSLLGSFESSTLVTDESGKLYLGELKNITTLRVDSIDMGDLRKGWNLPEIYSDNWSYPTHMELLEGATLELPVASLWEDGSKLDRRQISLVQSSRSGHVLSDWFDKIKLVKKTNAQSHYHLLRCENLKQGEYVFKLTGDKDLQISISVHKGAPWNNTESFFIKQNCIREIVSSQKIVKIVNSNLTQGQSPKFELKLSDHSKDARVHLFAQHFVAPETNTFGDEVTELLESKLQSSEFHRAKWDNIFMSNRKLGDEYRYVFDRSTAERQLGNLLDRPSLLMKRLFTRETEVEQEKLASGTDFNKYEEKMQMQSLAKEYHHAAREKKMAHYGGATVKKNYITEQQNFLKNEPLQVFNLIPDQNGVVSYSDAKLNDFSHLYVLVVDSDSTVQHTRSLGQDSANQISYRNLTLNKALDENKGLTQTRETVLLLKNQKDNIPEYLSSEIQLIDDLKKIEDALKQIRKLQGGHNNPAWSKLDFVLNWHSLQQEQKHRYLSEYGSHEFHFFIKQKDQAYFEGTVRGVLLNKMEKTLIDFYLLDDCEQIIKRYGKPHLCGKLCAFERCLLVESLAKVGLQTQNQGYMDQAKALVALMSDTIEVPDEGAASLQDSKNKIFDLVLKMNALEDAQNKHEEGKYSNSHRPVAAGAAMRRGGGGGGGGGLFGASSNSISNQLESHLKLEGFQQLDETSEYCETQYYQANDNHVQDNAFWRDYASFKMRKILEPQKCEAEFLSANFTDCNTSRETFLAICVLDMPFKCDLSVHQLKSVSTLGVDVCVGSNTILFKKEIKEVEISLKNDFMVTHRYHRRDAHGRQNADQNQAIPDEFIVNTPYSCEVIMTNVSPIKQKFSLLSQIPFGSMPIKRTKYMTSEPCELGPYSTQRKEFDFYFPSEGKKGHYPSNVSIDGKVTARGSYNELNVVRRRHIKKGQTDNFDDLIHVGTGEEILAYIEKENLLDSSTGFAFSKIYFLCKEQKFWQKCIEILSKRQIYDETIWCWAFKYGQCEKYLKEYLANTWKKQNNQALGPYFDSSLIQVIPDDFGFHKFLEYNPMINARAHAVGKDGKNKILNKTFRQTYDRFLSCMLYKKELSFADKLVFVYYLQLQDRITDAILLFQTLERPGTQKVAGEPGLAFNGNEALENINEGVSNLSELEVQYDYMAAYFDFFTGVEDGYHVARRVVMRYDNYPVSHWRLRFLAIADQLNEIDGEFDDPAAADLDESMSGAGSSSDASLRLAERKQENLKKSKKQEPNISLVDINEDGSLRIESVNIPSIAVKYYIIDAEILFSRAPFLKGNAEEFSYVKPFHTLNVAMIEEENLEDENITGTYLTKDVPIPENLANQNLVIEVNGGGQQHFKTHYASLLSVQIFESYGELKVTDKQSGKALSQVYVKVFSKDSSNKEVFFRDGYTDIRGKFEYAQTSGDKLKKVKKFAILVQSVDKGSQIKEVDPPVDEAMGSADSNQIAAQFGGMGQQSNLQQNKMQRMINRNMYVKSKKM